MPSQDRIVSVREKTVHLSPRSNQWVWTSRVAVCLRPDTVALDPGNAVGQTVERD